MFRFRVESHISIMFRDLHFTASAGIDGAVPGRSPRSPVHRAHDLAADLEQYTTHAELLDLHAVLDRHDDTETGEIRSILAAQAWNRTHQPPAGSPMRPPKAAASPS
jgi:hypothetical protein